MNGMTKNKIKRRTVIGCMIFTVLVSATIAIMGYNRFSSSTVEKYHTYAETILSVARDAFVRYNMTELTEQRAMDENYDKMRTELNSLKQNSEIAYIFAVTFDDRHDPDSMCFIINGARNDELEEAGDESEVYSYMGERCEEGDFDAAMREMYLNCFNEGMLGINFYENETDEYGRMLTAYQLITNSEGEPVAIINVDTDITDITNNLKYYVINMVIVALIFIVIFGILSVYVMTKMLVSPVTRIADSTNKFVGQMTDKVKPEELIYEDPKITTDDELGMLSNNVTDLANSVKTYMITLKHEMKEKERISAELNVATQIQADMLPSIFPPFPDRPEFDIYATMTPAKEVGGDFYDFFLIDEDHIALVMADVSGKGVPAALFMVIAKTLIKNHAQLGEYSPAKVLMQTNEQLCEGNEAELFVTVWLGIIEISTGKGLAANAGHENPTLRHKDGKFELIKYRHSPAVATMEGIRFKEHEFALVPGDTLFVYTDGVPEATDSSNELYGTDRMLDALNEEPDAPPKRILENVKASVDRFVGEAPQFDDLTMLGFTYFGTEDKK